MAGPWDDFADRPPDIRVTVRPNAQEQAGPMPWEEFTPQQQAPQPVGAGEDILRTIPAGVARGTISAATFPRDALDTVLGWAKQAGAGDDQIEIIRRAVNTAIPFTNVMPGKQAQQLLEENVTGELYKPQTRPGRYANTISEFAPAAAAPGRLLSNVLKFVAVPGVVSEAAGETAQTIAPSAEPYARAAGAIVPSAALAALTRPTAQNALRQYAGNAQPQHIQQAEALFAEAQQLGMPITRAEALQAVTNGATRMGDLQRVLEGQGGMQQAFAQRPAQNAQAFGVVADSVQPQPTATPSTIGPQAAETAGQVLTDVRGAINRATDPYYQATRQAYLSPGDMQMIRNTVPGFDEAVAAVRGNVQRNRNVANLPDNNVSFLNEVKKYLDEAAENASAPMNTQRSRQIASGYEQDASAVRRAAEAASPEYTIALQAQAQARQQYLDPLLRGPLGKLAKDDLPTQRAIEALFPQNPVPNSAGEIATAVSALAHRRPHVARDLVRAHLESTFNEATQNLVGGQNQFGGSKFAAVLRGNDQQAANLEAAIRSLPNGDRVWSGVDRFLTILEAQGTRQRPGSMTAFNQELLQDLRGGTGMGNVAKGINVTQLPAKVTEVWERWRLGKNVNELSRLLTDPRAAREFERLATAGPTQQIGLLARLTFLGSSSGRQPSSSPAQKR